jgi:hypothetical protein
MSELPHLKKYDEILKRIVAEYALQEKHWKRYWFSIGILSFQTPTILCYYM